MFKNNLPMKNMKWPQHLVHTVKIRVSKISETISEPFPVCCLIAKMLGSHTLFRIRSLTQKSYEKMGKTTKSHQKQIPKDIQTKQRTATSPP